MKSQIIILHTNGKRTIYDNAVTPNLTDLQEWVGGLIEAVPCGPVEGQPAQMFIHEEGKLRNMAPNRAATELAWAGGMTRQDVIVGPAVVLTGKARDLGT